MNTAIIYTRVSSDEQVSGTSLTTQERDLRAFCAREGYDVIAHTKTPGKARKQPTAPGSKTRSRMRNAAKPPP